MARTEISRFEARERLTGMPIPPALKYYRLQIDFAVAALSRLDPCPVDYVSDMYWPTRLEQVTPVEVTRSSS